MPSEKHRLPGGRGIYTDEQAFIGQGESFEGRRATIAAQDGIFISASHPYDYNGTSALTANITYLHPILPALTYDVSIESVRLRVTTLSAGQNFRTALYSFDLAERVFNMVTGTASTFPTDATGVLTQSLLTGNTKEPIRLMAGTVYYSAFKPSDGTAAVQTNAGSSLLYRLQLVATAGALSPLFHFKNLARAESTVVPGVVYLSRMWRDII